MEFTPNDEQWEKMKKHIKSNKYKKEDFFVFETLAVGDKIVPNRYLKVTPALLSIMRDDAEKGVSLMLNHNWNNEGVQSIPIGKVFDGRIEQSSQEGETEALYTSQYILRDDSKVDGYSKNDIIKLIETGILADTSVGWGTTRESYKCSICGNCIYDWSKCEHIPGKKYIVNEETNEVKQCIVEANPPSELHKGNNVLMENSVVFDGAYPNAVIQSKIDGITDSKGNMFKILEEKEELNEKDMIFGYTSNGNINLLYKKQMNEKGGSSMANVNSETETNEINNEVNSVTTEETANTETTNTESAVSVETNEVTEETQVNEVEETNEVTETESTSSSITYTETEILEKFGNISNSMEELVKLAKEGLENRESIILKALENGVHFMGNDFNKEVFKATFSNMDTKSIEIMSNEWKKQADALFSKTRVSKDKETRVSLDNKVNLNKETVVDLNQFKTGNY